MQGQREARLRHTDDGDIVLGGLELPEGDIDGDTTLTLGLELVKNPRILEGTLAELSGFLLSGVSPLLGVELKVDKDGEAGWVGPCAPGKKISLSGFVCPSPALIRDG